MSTTPAINATGPITVTFSFNEPFVEQALEGLSQEELWRAPTSHNNPILWVAGHVVQTRATVLQMLGRSIRAGGPYSIAGQRSEIEANIRLQLRWRVLCGR